MKDILYITI